MDAALFNIFDLPMVLAIFIGMILACVLVIYRPQTHRHLLLAAYLYALSFVELEKVIFWSMPLHRLFESGIPQIFALGKYIGLLVPPLLYLYMRVSSTNEKPVSSADTWLFAIPLLGVVLAVLLYQSLGSNPDQYLPSNYHAIFFNPVFMLTLLCKYGLFFAFAVLFLKRKNQTDVESKLVVVGSLSMCGFEFVTDCLAALETNGALLDGLGILHNYMVLFYVCLMLVYMLKQYFLKIPHKSRKNRVAAQKILSQDVSKIQQLMMEHKYYLDAEISLENLAKKLKMPEYQLSSLLNKNFQKNFFDFINYYRTEHAKGLISSSTSKTCSMLDILYDSGFNSKSAFNRCFKKYTGITPSEYRDKVKAIS